jgi:hypothetical protein
MSQIQEKLIKAGVKNLKTFGYPQVDDKNILTDMIYSQFFLGMLEDNKGHDSSIDKEIDALIAVIKENDKPEATKTPKGRKAKK